MSKPSQLRAAPQSPNLFLQTHAMALGRKEDHLTEFIAAVLATSPRFAEDYLSFVLAAFAPARRWGRLRLSQVETQRGFRTTGTPDMVLTVEDEHGRGHLVACEHKIEAAETIVRRPSGIRIELEPAGAPDTNSDSDDETAELLQLDRYLESEHFEAVLYVRESYRNMRDSVVEHARYVRPSGGADHFLWRDFHPALARSASDHVFAAWLLEGFGQLGYTPPSAVLGDLYAEDRVERRKNRENLGKLWSTTRSRSRAMGWRRSGLGSKVELYLHDNPESAASDVFVNPVKGAHVVVTITPRAGLIDRIYERLRAHLPSYVRRFASMTAPPEVVRGEAKRTKGRDAVVRVTSSLPAILGDASTTHDIEVRLAEYVGGILAIIDDRNVDPVGLPTITSKGRAGVARTSSARKLNRAGRSIGG